MYRPHDLLWLTDPAALITDGPMPAWATAPWLAVAPVVVRRAKPAQPDRLPVGLRGATRSERCAAQVPLVQVLRAETPEEIVRAWLRHAGRRPHRVPCLQALAALAPALDAQALAWGVTGSVGFTLASGFDVLRPGSDLDLLIRAPRSTDAKALRHVAALLEGMPARVDVQVETPMGAFALREWSRTGGSVLLKTIAGPVLADDPWRLAAHATTA